MTDRRAPRGKAEGKGRSVIEAGPVWSLRVARLRVGVWVATVAAAATT